MSRQIMERLPAILPRERDSKMRRFVEAHEEELEAVESDVDQIILSHQVSNASGDDLDRIGRMFGSVGRRRGRSDENYRAYLRGIVKAFSGRGTEPSMREGISAAFEIDYGDVQIEEDTEEVAYDLVLYGWSPHSTENLYEIADIVDPSGVEQRDIRYILDEEDVETVGVSDSVDIREVDVLTTDTAVVGDSVSITETDVLVWNTNNWDESVWPTAEKAPVVEDRETGQYGGTQFGETTY